LKTKKRNKPARVTKPKTVREPLYQVVLINGRDEVQEVIVPCCERDTAIVWCGGSQRSSGGFLIPRRLPSDIVELLYKVGHIALFAEAGAK
jgi:hypothetical protein